MKKGTQKDLHEFATAVGQEEIDAEINKEGYRQIIGMIAPPRIGVQTFLARMEHELCLSLGVSFPLILAQPEDGLAQNPMLALLMARPSRGGGRQKGVLFAVTAIHEKHWDLAVKLAADCGLKPIEGVPMLYYGGTPSALDFIMTNPYHLEHLPDSKIYTMTQREIVQEHRKEAAFLGAYFGKIETHGRRVHLDANEKREKDL